MHTDMEAGPQVSGAFRVDVSRGANVSRVASEWYSRPADQRFLSLSDLYASVRGRAKRSHTRTVESRAVRVCALVGAELIRLCGYSASCSNANSGASSTRGNSGR